MVSRLGGAPCVELDQVGAYSPTRVKVTLVAFLLAGAIGVSAGCGGGRSGDGDKTFEREDISFTYPGEWEELDPGEGAPGAIFDTAFGPQEGLDGLIFEINDAGTPVTEGNIDAVVEDVAGGIQESTEGPTRLTVAGLPAMRIVSHPQSDLTRRITMVFDGATAYIFNCGFTPPRAEEMQRGCDQVEESFQIE